VKITTKALKRIEKLWGAAPGTAEGNVLDALMTLVEAYEREHSHRFTRSGGSHQVSTGAAGTIGP